MTDPLPGSTPGLALPIRLSTFSLYLLVFLKRLLWAAAVLPPAFGAEAAVVLTTLHSFTGANDGGYPIAGLVQGSDSFFYGTTFGGGMNGGYGTVFKMSANGALTSLYSFGTIQDAYGDSLDGAGPQALVQGSDGNLYGTTEFGGFVPPTRHPGEIFSLGTVFRISTNGALTTFHDFGTATNAEGDLLSGVYPLAGLARGGDSYFYGTTSGGWPPPCELNFGSVDNGTVFNISTNGALATLYSFTDGSDGASPQAGLVQGGDGNFYGTTIYGGTNGLGTVFQMSTNGALTSLYSFSGGNDGAGANGLALGSDGFFYGTTLTYGANGVGTVFKISTNGTLTTLYAFGTITNANGYALDGANPSAALVQAGDGYFYGTTSGVNNCASSIYGNSTIFKISTNGALTTLYSFTGGNDGANVTAGLVQGSDGSFYGTTYNGGAGGAGTVFRLTIVPEFQAATITYNMLSLTWSTEAGGVYQLQCNSDLSSSNWMNLNSAVTATGATLNTTDSVTNGPQRFYRLVVAP